MFKHRKLLLLPVSFALTACAPGPHLFVTSGVTDAVSNEMPPEMGLKNLIATVAFDQVGLAKDPEPARAGA